jgi:hypothetical protein
MACPIDFLRKKIKKKLRYYHIPPRRGGVMSIMSAVIVKNMEDPYELCHILDNRFPNLIGVL